MGMRSTNYHTIHRVGFPGGASGKGPACQCRRLSDMGLIPRLGRSPGGGRGNPLQYSYLENPMDKGACHPWGCKESDMTEATEQQQQQQ